MEYRIFYALLMENGLILYHRKVKRCALQSSNIIVFQIIGIIVLNGVFLVFSYKKSTIQFGTIPFQKIEKARFLALIYLRKFCFGNRRFRDQP